LVSQVHKKLDVSSLIIFEKKTIQVEKSAGMDLSEELTITQINAIVKNIFWISEQ